MRSVFTGFGFAFGLAATFWMIHVGKQLLKPNPIPSRTTAHPVHIWTPTRLEVISDAAITANDGVNILLRAREAARYLDNQSFFHRFRTMSYATSFAEQRTDALEQVDQWIQKVVSETEVRMPRYQVFEIPAVVLLIREGVLTYQEKEAGEVVGIIHFTLPQVQEAASSFVRRRK